MSRRSLAALAGAVSAVALGAAGCGSSDTGQPNDQGQQAAKAADVVKGKLQIVAPAPEATIRGQRVEVRGTVTPPDAEVQITGLTAAVEDGGLFHRSIPLSMGSNTVDVVATKVGMEPVTMTIDLTRGRSEAAIARAAAAAERAAARRKARREAAAARRAAARKAAANAKVAVPSLVGERLDVAEEMLQSKSLRFKEIGGGTFGIVVPSNWTVCETRPGAGAQVHKRTRIALIVDRAC